MVQTPELVEEGFVLVPNLLDTAEIASLIEQVERMVNIEEGRGGLRNLLDLPIFRELAESPNVRSVVSPILGQDAFVVRGILFDKTDAANWKVPWHQDVTIAVNERIESPGYGPWSTKARVLHVQPPASVLEHMISVRIHLDECPTENGALRVLPRTHAQGKLSQQKIDELVANSTPYTCEAAAGEALLMSPLLLHASSASTLPKHRRVLHFDYASIELASGLEWRERLTIPST